MVNVTQLFAMAKKEGIDVEYGVLPEMYRALYVTYKGNSFILIQKQYINDERATRCLLAEELGHYFTKSVYHASDGTYLDYLNRMSCENNAMEWAVDLLIDTREFMKCQERGDDYREIAVEFGVWPELVWYKEKLLHERYEKTA